MHKITRDQYKVKMKANKSVLCDLSKGYVIYFDFKFDTNLWT